MTARLHHRRWAIVCDVAGCDARAASSAEWRECLRLAAADGWQISLQDPDPSIVDRCPEHASRERHQAGRAK